LEVSYAPYKPPSYRLHKAWNCAVVTINGENRYLGPYGSPESHEKYARLIAQWQANGKDLATIAAPTDNGELCVNGLILRYLDTCYKGIPQEISRGAEFPAVFRRLGGNFQPLAAQRLTARNPSSRADPAVGSACASGFDGCGAGPAKDSDGE
jgi:hypothetical protein